ncbi:MAG: ATP-binding protein [Actinomycetota bacterium]|nr:ATP-binding protein [Actinomycetota bacterium]MDQ2955356.1 ATP-binding protein [Actinomycetota bacterium]
MSTLWVRHAPSSAAVARKGVQVAFQKAGLSADDAYDAALIASELVGNSVRHAAPLPSGHLAIEWTLDEHGYLLSVTDGGGEHDIAERAADGHAVGGRGLMIVAALSRSWGVAVGKDTTTVWARGSIQPVGTSQTGELQASY